MIIKFLKALFKPKKPHVEAEDQQSRPETLALPTIRLDEIGKIRKCDICGALLDSNNYQGEYRIDPNVMREVVSYVIKHRGGSSTPTIPLPDLEKLTNHQALALTKPYTTCKKCLKVLNEIYFNTELCIDKSVRQN